MTGIFTDRFNKILSTMDDDKFIRTYMGVINYFKPKFSSSDNRNIKEVIEVLQFVINTSDMPDLLSNID